MNYEKLCPVTNQKCFISDCKSSDGCIRMRDEDCRVTAAVINTEPVEIENGLQAAEEFTEWMEREAGKQLNDMEYGNY